MSEDKPIKVAIIGGGCASMTAAFELSRPEHAGTYQLTVYQLGWRLGGKGASGRGPADRIEEHGLHLWMGFYENAFRLMRECYAELDRDRARCPIADWQDAFVPAPFVGVMERDAEGAWSPWAASFPPTEGLPGDPHGEAIQFSVADYLARTVALVRTLLESVSAAQPGAGTPTRPSAPPAPPATLLDRLADLLKFGELASLAALIEAIALLETVLGDLSAYSDNVLLRFLDALAANARGLLEQRAAEDRELRRVWTILDLTLATMRGMVRFGLIDDPRGFDAIDEYDCREWLLLNGASEQSVHSAYMRGLYDLVFAYEDGDPARPRISAGQALRSTLRAFFTYRGSFFWKMQAGMGDIVFAPLYEVLKRRGVRFEFFHRLENVKLVDGAALTAGEAAVRRGARVRRAGRDRGRRGVPAARRRARSCRAGPPVRTTRSSSTASGCARKGGTSNRTGNRAKASRRTLRVGEDFDVVVLGVGLGAVPHVCREIVARDPRWRAMVDHVKTVATQAFQIWMNADMRELGWAGPPITVSGFVEPFDTWADMRHLLAARDLAGPAARARLLLQRAARSGRAERAPRCRLRPRATAAAYDATRSASSNASDRPSVARRQRRSPAVSAGSCSLDAERKSALARANGAFDSQFWTANVNPSDRYALSLPGSSAYRISPLDDTYDNLTVAGDWTDCGFNAGCVEAAVMSGRLAAHAVCGSPRLEDIVGFDHP